MIPEPIRAEILRRLAAVEQDEGVRILFAIESGSRAWGFASPDSDYDVRFIYSRPAEWYLSIDVEGRRDVIERPIEDDIDLGGWDVRKALRLLWESNPAYVEWIQSPIVYRDASALRALSSAALPEVYKVESGFHHYRSMAKRTFEEHLCRPRVSLKKYFYVLRPLLAVRWLETHGSAAPIEFPRMLPLLNEQPEVLESIDQLLEVKRRTPELGLSERVPVLDAFIRRELERLESQPLSRTRPPASIDTLNRIFRQVLAEGAG